LGQVDPYATQFMTSQKILIHIRQAKEMKMSSGRLLRKQSHNPSSANFRTPNEHLRYLSNNERSTPFVLELFHIKLNFMLWCIKNLCLYFWICIMLFFSFSLMNMKIPTFYQMHKTQFSTSFLSTNFLYYLN
jgi:uncharacterized ion transporter superfamily protein YfcC